MPSAGALATLAAIGDTFVPGDAEQTGAAWPPPLPDLAADPAAGPPAQLVLGAFESRAANLRSPGARSASRTWTSPPRGVPPVTWASLASRSAGPPSRA